MRIDEKQCDLHGNLQRLLEQEMFSVLNISKQHNAECTTEAHLMRADEGQRQVQPHEYMFYVCILKSPSISPGWRQNE